MGRHRSMYILHDKCNVFSGPAYSFTEGEADVTAVPGINNVIFWSTMACNHCHFFLWKFGGKSKIQGKYATKCKKLWKCHIVTNNVIFGKSYAILSSDDMIPFLQHITAVPEKNEKWSIAKRSDNTWQKTFTTSQKIPHTCNAFEK